MDPSHISSEFSRAIDEWDDSEPETYLDDRERYGDRDDLLEEEIDDYEA
jgi:hypothetical protein